MEEIEIYRKDGDKKQLREDVLVTNARFIVGSNTYAMSGITSVKKSKIPAKRSPGIVMAAIGASVMYAADSKGWQIFGGVLLFLGVVAFFIEKPTYVVTICSSSTETKALENKDEAYIDAVINALNTSIIKRG
ncbi:DUF6232 family protein [Serratia marcescens]|uniref:DUF6232 family protein n=1 Tax=Serratia marcescens TaxID=615 RepID=UPI0021BD2965|nr:DUF6232 family protein [Serratia marcescens]